MDSKPKKGKRRSRGREKSLPPGEGEVPKKSVFDSLYDLGGLSDPDEVNPDDPESDSKAKRVSGESRASRRPKKASASAGSRKLKDGGKQKAAPDKTESESDVEGFYSLKPKLPKLPVAAKAKATKVTPKTDDKKKTDGQKPKLPKFKKPKPSSAGAKLPTTPTPDVQGEGDDDEANKEKAKPKKSEAQKRDEALQFLNTMAAAGDDDDDDDLPIMEEVELAINEAEAEGTLGGRAQSIDKSELNKLDKFIELPAETVKQQLNRAKKVHEGKLDAAYGPLEIMNYQKKAIIKAAVIRARRHDRVYRKLARNWDSSSESEECVDCYTPKSIRKEKFKAHASYHHGVKRASLFATIVKWAVLFIGLFDYMVTFYIITRIYTYQMWLTYFRAKRWLNCVEDIVSAYQFEVLFYCANMVNSVNLIYTLRRNKWKFMSYWLCTQLVLCIVAPIPAFAGARFNAKNGNVGSIIRAQVFFHCLIVIKVGIVLYRMYMVRKPFHWRRLKWFIKAERDRQLNQDLDARNSSFIQKKNSYRNAFNTALYSVIKTLVDHFETHGKSLSPDEVGEIIKKYDETLNDITMYPGIEQYLRMAYIRFCVKRGMKDKRILARQTQFFKLRDERMKRIAMEKIEEAKRKSRIRDEASVGGEIEILPAYN